jgi:uncharacterized phiE125 gp8 family phage protein
LSRLITTARLLAEAFTGRAFITQTLTLQLDAFPPPNLPWWDGVREGSIAQWSSAEPILLPRPPLQAVTSVTWFDTTNAPTVFDAANYYVDAMSEPGRLVPSFGVAWPSGVRARAAAHIVFTAGYGLNAGSVPVAVKEAILAHIRDAVERPNAAISSEGIDNARVAYGGIRTGAAAGTGGPDATMGLRADAANILAPLRVLEAGL